MIIHSLLDTDIYKFYMMQAGFHQFPDTEVEYEFKCRSEDVDLSRYVPEIKKEIRLFCRLYFKKEEISYLRSLKIFQENFLTFLENFHLDASCVDVQENPFKLRIKGNWFHTILFETPILAIISEIYRNNNKGNFKGYTNLGEKISLINFEGIKFADFGTRRRHSFHWHHEVIKELIEYCPNQFIGTSNIYLAKKYNLKPIGTMAHEWLQAGQSLTPNGLETSQKFMLQKWLDEYDGELGIALTDVINMDCFLKDFGKGFAEVYQGCRQDSGNPFEWGNKLIQHYHHLGIDHTKKTAVFSDGLDFEKMIQINDYFENKINCVFGIGTNLTNDVGIKPLNIVIKMTKCNGKPVAKISDSPGKGMCQDNDYLKKLREAFGLD
jgi:nicotinate phosphoribosyltransferase